MTTALPTGIDLTGLGTGPAQLWGAVRLVPLLRDEPVAGLRLHARAYDPHDVTVVRVTPGTEYVAYVPHAFVADWDTGGDLAAYGTQLRQPSAEGAPAGIGVHRLRRMARRQEGRRLRFLPLHLALEGYLALHFGGPSVAWQEWSDRALRRGLSPRAESTYPGWAVTGLAEALRVFEIHPRQCGVLLYVADALAAAFVVPHPEDYRALHPTLLADSYGELLYEYGRLYPSAPRFAARIDDRRVTDLAGLRAEIARVHTEWADFHATMAAGLLAAARPAFSPVYRMGRFTLSRFLPAFDPHGENHIGELITDGDGRTAYLKTFRLSAAQARRGHLLATLAAHDWNLDAAATALGGDRSDLVGRLVRAGFDHLLRQDVLDGYRARARRAARG